MIVKNNQDNVIGTRVLLADDCLDMQYIETTLLEEAGAIVEVANNGQEAIDKAMAGAYDIVLMDMQMPIVDGYEATKKLRSLGFDIPIVAITAHAMKEDRERCLAAGCSDYLTKPIRRALLLSKVADVAKGPRAAASSSPSH